MFQVKCPQKGLRIIPMVINGASGTPAIAEGAFQGSVVDTGAGIYTVTYAQALARAAVILVTPLTSDIIAHALSSTVTGFQVRIADGSDGTTLKDGNVQIVILGFDAPDEV